MKLLNGALSCLSKGALALLLVPVLNFGSSALASENDTAQLFKCKDNTANVSFQQTDAKSKKFAIGSTKEVAVLVVDGQQEGSCGITYEYPQTPPFRFITWYYKQAAKSKALENITVRYCFSLADGTKLPTFDIQGGSSDRGGPVGDGWSDVVQDTRVFPGDVLGGKARIDRITFIFKGKNGPSNITLGKIDMSNGAKTDTLLLDVGGCELKQKCDGTTD